MLETIWVHVAVDAGDAALPVLPEMGAAQGVHAAALPLGRPADPLIVGAAGQTVVPDVLAGIHKRHDS